MVRKSELDPTFVSHSVDVTSLYCIFAPPHILLPKLFTYKILMYLICIIKTFVII